MAKGQVRSTREKRKPKAKPPKKSAALAPARLELGPSSTFKLRLFTKGRSAG